MRIAFFNSWTLQLARGSGTAAGISGLAFGLERLGHEVVMFRPQGGIFGQTVRRLLYNINLGIHPPTEVFQLAVGFDIDGFLLPRFPGSKYVVCLKGISAEEMRFESGWPRVYLGVLSWLEGWNARRADRVIVPSVHSRREALRAYGLSPEMTAVVPEGIDLKKWDDMRKYPPLRRDIRPTILSVARQYPRKNTQLLVAAIPEVRAAIPDIRLRIIGGGPMLSSLREQIDRLGLNEAVELEGEIEEDEVVHRSFFQADVFCLPSLQEGFGIVFLEAMAAGLPIVAARSAAIPEVVPEDKVALLTPPEDSGALAEALIRLLKNCGLRYRLGSQGLIHVRRFDWPEVAASFLNAVDK